MSARRDALSRSLSAMTIGVVKAKEQRDRTDDLLGLRETEEQHRISIEGEASQILAWTNVEIALDNVYLAATGQREIPHETPQIWHGAEIESATPVLVTACVMEWKRTTNDEIVGATVAVGTMGEGPFSGYLHLTIQGFAAPSDDAQEMA